LLILRARRDGSAILKFASGDRALMIARILFGIALPLIGQSHIVFADATAGYIPGWIPDHLFFAYFTGMADIAAGLAVIFMVVPRLASSLAALMMSLFTILIWIPTVVGAPMDRLSWTALMASTAISGGAWAVADTFRNLPWISWPGWLKR
jgi:uncharacterized membrane protein